MQFSGIESIKESRTKPGNLRPLDRKGFPISGYTVGEPTEVFSS